MLKDNPIRAEYMAHIKKQKTSGLSIKKYCEENNLIEHKLKYYLSYFLKPRTTAKNSAFASVKIKPEIIKQNFNKIDPIWLAEFLNKLLVKK